MLFFTQNAETKHKIDRALEQSCPEISPEGKEVFYNIEGHFAELECLDWIFRSCFMKDGKFIDDNVIMKFGDMWPKEGLLYGVDAEVAAQKMFGLFAQNAMLDRIILSIVTLIMGRGEDESSFLNFANQKCVPSEIEADIKDALKIVGEPVVQSAKTCRNCKSMIRGEKSTVKYSCAIDGFDDMKTFRDKRVAHRDLNYGRDEVRLQYLTIENCIQRILQAMRVVYPDADISVDWRKRRDIISTEYFNTPPWTTNPGEPRIVQNLKELVIRRYRDDLGWLQSLDPYGTNQSVQKKMDEICDEIEKIRAS